MKKWIVLAIISSSAWLLGACSPQETLVPTEIPAAATSAPATDVVASPVTTSAPVEQESEEAPEQEIIVLELVPEETEARFVIGEILRGQDNTVVGSTRQVQGEIRIDPGQPHQSSLGLVQVDADSLATDSGMRDRAIANFILQTGTYPSITFEATAVDGIPENAALGQTLTLQIRGNLTIRDITREVMFVATATPVSDTRLEGSASATIQRTDFELSIPSVPSVASVDEEVILEIDLVARPAEGS